MKPIFKSLITGALLGVGFLLYVVVGSNPTWYFVSNRAYGLVTLTLKLGANPNSCDNRGHDCPLLVAAVFEDLKMIKILERNGADLHVLNEYGQNALNAQCVNTEIMGYFIDKGVNVNNPERGPRNAGMTPLHCAVLNNSSEAVRFLISKGADKTKTLSSWGGKKDVTPLQLAELKSQNEIIALLK